MLAEIVEQQPFVDLVSGCWADERPNSLAPAVVWEADNRHLSHCLMLEKQLFKFLGVDVLATANDPCP